MKGYFLARAVKESLQFGKAGTGSKQVGLSLRITEEGSQYKGMMVGWYGSLVEGDAMRITLDSLANAGHQFNNNKITDPTGLGDVDCIIVVDEEPQVDSNKEPVLDPKTGEQRMISRVKFINRVGGVVMKDPMSEDEKNDLDNMLAGTLANRTSGRPSTGGVTAPANGEKAPF